MSVAEIILIIICVLFPLWLPPVYIYWSDFLNYRSHKITHRKFNNNCVNYINHLDDLVNEIPMVRPRDEIEHLNIKLYNVEEALIAYILYAKRLDEMCTKYHIVEPEFDEIIRTAKNIMSNRYGEEHLITKLEGMEIRYNNDEE